MDQPSSSAWATHWPGARVRNQELTCSNDIFNDQHPLAASLLKMTWSFVIMRLYSKNSSFVMDVMEKCGWKHCETPPMAPPFWQFHVAPPTQQFPTWRCKWHNFLTLTCSLCLVMTSQGSFLHSAAPGFEVAELHRTPAARARGAWRAWPAQSALAIIWTECRMRTTRMWKVLLIDLGFLEFMDKIQPIFLKRNKCRSISIYMRKGMRHAYIHVGL